MAAKMGRPTDSPKNVLVQVRMDAETIKMLDESAQSLKISRSEVIRMGVKKVHESIRE